MASTVSAPASTNEITVKSRVKIFGGQLVRFSHLSRETKTSMTVSVFLPPHEENADSVFPMLLYLSGLTCTDENVVQKSGVFKSLSESKIAFVATDTSPRGAGVEGESDSGWDFGVGAGFYLDATESKWATNYRMYSYIMVELFEVLREHFKQIDIGRKGIFGHSMGGHGALSIALKNPHAFRSVSAFAPICHPTNCPWGRKAFTGYLGGNEEAWAEYDSTRLLQSGRGAGQFDDILIDVGTADKFLGDGQLLPEDFVTAANAVGQRVTLRYQDGYDHSYFFISTFIQDHVQFHAARLHS